MWINSQESATQEVERILDSRRREGGLQYLFKRQGQQFEESTREDRSEVIKGALQLCQDFHNSHPDAPRAPTIRIPEIMQRSRKDATSGRR